MKNKHSSKSGFFYTRGMLAFLLCSVAAVLCTFSFRTSAQGPTPGAVPSSGTLTSANIGTANALNYADAVGSAPNDTFLAGQGTCMVPLSCSTFTLTIDPSVGTPSTGYDPTKYDIFMELSWSQSAIDYDTWVCSTGGNCVQGNVIAFNNSNADPETITLPTTTAPGQYTINLVAAEGAFEPYNATIYLKAKPGPQGNCTAPADCTPPRYINYPAGTGQGDGAGEPSIGIDWNPNFPSLKDTTSPIFTTGTKRLNTGGVAFMTMNGGPGGGGTTQNGPLGEANWRVNFDDCPSPAINLWEDVSSNFAQSTATIDPIGFTDHYSNQPLGLTYPEPHTTGRVFQTQLIGLQGNSLGAYSDDDGNSYLPGANGGFPSGPDHETLGGGPYNPNSTPPPPPQAVAYGSPNAIYYCSQNTVGEAECSRSDNGGQTFGPGIPIYNPTVCTGAIHGHVKVARDGTVYVPNSSCGTSNNGVDGMAVSTDNGITWTENNVPNSTGSQDPSVGIGQNDVGRPAGKPTNTIYLGWISGDGHPHIADSHDRGLTWEHETDVGINFGVQNSVFPVVVAGDDNRAAFGFLGTGPAITTPGAASPCDPYNGLDSNSNFNCQNVWHLYIATTYDGGANWITIDVTPNDPVQVGGICLLGFTCNSPPRNLLDFNDFGIDAEGRGLLGYADGCVNCNNGQTSQSGDAHATVARQSGGRRLFSHFDPTEPMAPASPQLVSAVSQSGGTLVSWLEPDNGGSPITGYKVYRGGTSGGETPLATVSGETNTKYLDPAPLSGGSFYYAQAINAIGEGGHCGELTTVTGGTKCQAPYITEGGAGAFQPAPGLPADPTMGQLTLQRIAIGEPFSGNCTEKSITFTMKVQELSPMPLPAGIWRFFFFVKDTTGASREVFVSMDTISATPSFNYGYRSGSTTSQCGATGTAPGGGPCPATGTFNTDGTITIKLNVAQSLEFFSATNTSGVPDFIVDIPVGTNFTNISGETYTTESTPVAGAQEVVQIDGGNGTYTTVGNLSCHQLPPIGVLSATPTSGGAPLTVSFDGTHSHPQTGACGTINSYTINFGDGSALVTNSTGTFSHTYNAAGDYPATLTVTDTLGVTSVNPAQVTISVTSPLNLISVVSRMTHGSIANPGEVNFPLTGTRGVECRSSTSLGAGNYTIVFQFDGALSTVTGASATATGPNQPTVSSSGIGLNNHEYLVNLSGVPNGQYLTVTLNGVAGANNGGTVVGPQMGMLIGDVNGDGQVDSSDLLKVKQQTLQPVTTNPTGNFREDVNADGNIDSSDLLITKRQTLTGLPTPP